MKMVNGLNVMKLRKPLLSEGGIQYWPNDKYGKEFVGGTYVNNAVVRRLLTLRGGIVYLFIPKWG